MPSPRYSRPHAVRWPGEQTLLPNPMRVNKVAGCVSRRCGILFGCCGIDRSSHSIHPQRSPLCRGRTAPAGVTDHDRVFVICLRGQADRRGWISHGKPRITFDDFISIFGVSPLRHMGARTLTHVQGAAVGSIVSIDGGSMQKTESADRCC